MTLACKHAPMLLRITSRYFVAGVVVGERAAPIVGYMTQWDEARIRRYCASKGWVVE